mmetsp:Transcript_74317/g.214811  ORF Transcript_74317/g.214811 Transcript_74317/m.214811 type:complete len:272 (+) Transcript_74317:908-1723(+)
MQELRLFVEEVGKALRELLRAGDRLDEDQHLPLLEHPVHMFGEPLPLLVVVLDDLDMLLDGGGRLAFLADRDAGGQLQDVACELLDLWREGGRKQQRLPARTHILDDGPHLVLETKVEHPVGLVEHNEGHPAERATLHLHNVDQPARVAYRDFTPALDLLELLQLGKAAGQRRAPQAKLAIQLVCLLLDLHRQLARRAQYDTDGTLALLQLLLGDAVHQHRQKVCDRLPRTRLRDADDVAAGERRGDGLSLDRRRLRVAVPSDGLHELRPQ